MLTHGAFLDIDMVIPAKAGIQDYLLEWSYLKLIKT